MYRCARINFLTGSPYILQNAWIPLVAGDCSNLMPVRLQKQLGLITERTMKNAGQERRKETVRAHIFGSRGKGETPRRGEVEWKAVSEYLCQRGDNMNNEQPGEQKKQIIEKTRFDLNNDHYAAVESAGNLRFIRYTTGDPMGFNGLGYTWTNEVVTQDPDDPTKDVIIRPARQIGQQRLDRVFDKTGDFGLVKYPPSPIPYTSDLELYAQIRRYLYRYVELSNTDEILCSLWIMKATIFDAIRATSFPLIHVLAPYGKGKSRLLSTMTELTPYGVYLINVKSAALKRISAQYSAILYVDEKSRMDDDEASIINAKYNRNSLVLNADKEIQRGSSSLIGYPIFGPMVIAGRQRFPDDAIESKSFQVSLNFDLSRKDVPRKLRGRVLDEFQSEGKEIRGKLLSFRVRYHEKINGVEEEGVFTKYEEHLEPRLFEILTFFSDISIIIPELKVELDKVIHEQVLKNVEAAAETPNGIVANTVLDLMDNAESFIEYTTGGKGQRGLLFSSVTDSLGEGWGREAGKVLNRLGVITERVWTGSGGHKHKSRVVRLPDKSKEEELRSRYDVEYMKRILDGLNAPKLLTLDSEDSEDRDIGTPPLPSPLYPYDCPHGPHCPNNPSEGE